MQKITPFLWFDGQAEEAMKFYASVFKRSKEGKVSRNGDQVFSASFELDGLEFIALNGGPQFTFTEAISMYVNCEDQKEVDYYWQKLTENGGSESQCGWLKDKFGLSWQIIPAALPRLLGDADSGRAGRAMQAMLTMKKIDVAKLEAAANG
jgi:predicted 3-demethylubiquinone-9 3-methyltransferase (glyoxalase superfamily)